MLIVLSPAKTLDYSTPATTNVFSKPDFIEHSEELIKRLRDLTPSEIARLMRVSDALAVLNAARFASWSSTFTLENAKQSIFAFNGDVYEGLDAMSFNKPQLEYAQSRIRILSGLYGLLRPLDLMQPYRLEMGTQLDNQRGRNLYMFWGNLVTNGLNTAIDAAKAHTLVNLASEEYFKVVKTTLLNATVTTPVFEDWKNGKYKVISFFAKRARGLMVRYAAINAITKAEDLKEFDLEGYRYSPKNSTAHRWIFRRKQG